MKREERREKREEREKERERSSPLNFLNLAIQCRPCLLLYCLFGCDLLMPSVSFPGRIGSMSLLPLSLKQILRRLLLLLMLLLLLVAVVVPISTDFYRRYESISCGSLMGGFLVFPLVVLIRFSRSVSAFSDYPVPGFGLSFLFLFLFLFFVIARG